MKNLRGFRRKRFCTPVFPPPVRRPSVLICTDLTMDPHAFPDAGTNGLFPGTDGMPPLLPAGAAPVFTEDLLGSAGQEEELFLQREGAAVIMKAHEKRQPLLSGNVCFFFLRFKQEHDVADERIERSNRRDDGLRKNNGF